MQSLPGRQPDKTKGTKAGRWFSKYMKEVTHSGRQPGWQKKHKAGTKRKWDNIQTIWQRGECWLGSIYWRWWQMRSRCVGWRSGDENNRWAGEEQQGLEWEQRLVTHGSWKKQNKWSQNNSKHPTPTSCTNISVEVQVVCMINPPKLHSPSNNKMIFHFSDEYTGGDADRARSLWVSDVCSMWPD